MERNTQTTIDQLQIGDRFYKSGDKNKTVWTKVEHRTKVTKHQTYRNWAKADGGLYPEALRNNSPVVYLRSATEPGNATGPPV